MEKWLCVVSLTGLITLGFRADAQGPAVPDRLQWWREARFGMFIHWGPVSLKGTEIGWSRGGERRGTGGQPGPIPVEVYDNLYKEFNPTEFNAREWVAIAKKAGMKYLVFTTRHHDGFSMFDTALSDYKITNSPFKRDVVAELAQACHDAGLRLGFYYSPPDWHHPDYRTENHARFLEYLHGQVRELCTKYGKLDIFWFDGLGGIAKDWDSERLIKMIRELQPDIIINNRAGLPEDYDTPEQRIGQFQKNRPWETCMTIGYQWAWKPDDKIKSFRECLEVLVRCAGGDGNLLFNVGPMPNGRIEPRQVDRLMEMGGWLQRCGESIYGTRGGPFLPGRWGVSTYRDRTVYIHILDWGAVGKRLVLPPIKPRIVSASMLTGGTPTVKQTRKGVEIAVPASHQQGPDTIVILQLDGSAAAIEPVGLQSQSSSKGAGVKASNVYQNDPTFAPEKAVDEDDGTRWATDGGTHQAWLEIRLPKARKVGGVHIKEACGNRVRDFVLEYEDRGEWKPFYKGAVIGADFRATFKPVKTKAVRFNIREATEGPTFWEFQLIPRQ
jgi:alpha-L-fucosidase